MQTTNSKQESAPLRSRSTLQSTALVLGLYVAMHLGAGVLIHLATGRDASRVIAPGGPEAQAVAEISAAAASGEQARAAPTSLPRAAKRARECKLRSTIASECIFD